MRDRARLVRGVLAALVLVVIGLAAAAAATVAGAGTVVFVLLRLAFAREHPLTDILNPLGSAIGMTLVGALVWSYHHAILKQRTASPRLASALIVAGLGLVTAASGLGIVVNSLLAGLAPTVLGSDARSLLLGGLAPAVVEGHARQHRPRAPTHSPRDSRHRWRSDRAAGRDRRDDRCHCDRVAARVLIVTDLGGGIIVIPLLD
jgi:hypothetical protein